MNASKILQEEITLTLNRKEAEYLKGVTQNTFYEDPDDESEEEKSIRSSMFHVLKRVLE